MRSLLPLWLVGLLLAGSSGSAAFARSGDAESTPTMRQAVYNRLSRASQLAEEGDIDKAIENLRRVEKMDNLSDYEQAQLHTAYGFIHFSRNNYEESARSYESVLQLESLPAAMRSSTLYTLAQLYFQIDEYEKTIASLTDWMSGAENPGPEPYILLGQAYHELERYGEAIEPVETAIRIARQRDRKINESWYMLLRLFYHELRDYEKVLDILETLIVEYPRKEYWLQLSAIYGETGRERRQLAIYEMAYLQGELVEEREIVLLAQLLLQANIPFRSGVVLTEGIEAGLVKPSAENYRLLSHAWSTAREDRRAINALEQATSLSSDGEFDERLAYTYANLADWARVVTSARTALSKGVKREGDLQVLLGMALFEEGEFDAAKSAFRSAQSSPNTERTASQWVRYIETEQSRLAELARSFGD